ncbi:MAG: DNA-directed RNA polymerase subunit alpha [Candidatus Curtissbacteria bacterium GW2011_GWA1_40_9]|uniref:DNA-directed RNA polymerase subunit alpha n=1 Tax=Candidatus Curtissbacteria bacterium GW2011_GWA1_40_9 TaxID=1618408 RepID=A0A0G0W1M1_9BACT|nr:MAG: DNA-directed RNA polymerase subunit alpha [Candidatus Curtissbacteria bacterium GW2011_GWA1_40_9]
MLDLTDAEKIPISVLSLSTRARNCIRRSTGNYRNSLDAYPFNTSHVFYALSTNLPSVEEAGTLAMRTRDELLSMRNLGEKSVQEIEEKLAELGLSLATPENSQHFDPSI